MGDLRKLTEVSITKARDALAASNNDVNLALEWLQKDLVTSGSKKAARFQGRATGEGLISTCVLSNGIDSRSGLGLGGIRAAMVELNCETDFVARNDLFGRLAADIAHTAACIYDPTHSETAFQEFQLNFLNDAPLISQLHPNAPASTTVGSAVRDMISKVGEKILLRRVVTLARNSPYSPGNIGLRLASYNHSFTNVPSQGRIGSLVLLTLDSPRLAELLGSVVFQEELARLERSLARQIVGFDTTSITSPAGEKLETALYDQPFMMFPNNPTGGTVYEVLRNWSQERGLVITEQSIDSGGLAVIDFRKWIVGESLPAQ